MGSRIPRSGSSPGSWRSSRNGSIRRPTLPEDAIDRDRILTNVSLYWFTGTAGSSANLYYETLHDPDAKKPKARNTVPTGVAVSLTQDVTIRRWAERENNIVHWTEFDHGGHFAALEVPEFLVDDMRKFFRKDSLNPERSEYPPYLAVSARTMR